MNGWNEWLRVWNELKCNDMKFNEMTWDGMEWLEQWSIEQMDTWINAWMKWMKWIGLVWHDMEETNDWMDEWTNAINQSIVFDSYFKHGTRRGSQPHRGFRSLRRDLHMVHQNFIVRPVVLSVSHMILLVFSFGPIGCPSCSADGRSTWAICAYI